MLHLATFASIQLLLACIMRVHLHGVVHERGSSQKRQQSMVSLSVTLTYTVPLRIRHIRFMVFAEAPLLAFVSPINTLTAVREGP